MAVRRLDRGGELQPPKRLPNGWLRLDAYFTRTGVLLYRNPDGTVRRELRLPEEVFKADSLETLKMVPVTDGHPSEFLDSSNTAKYQRGHTGESIRNDGTRLGGSVMVIDSKLAGELERGSKREVSCGYTCELEESPGVTESGERYDCIQRGIVYNHVAIVERGRAGPDVRVRMDKSDAIEVSADSTQQHHEDRTEVATVKTRIDGVEYDVPEQAAQAIAKVEKAHADELAKLRADGEATAKRAEQLQAKLDTAAEELKKKDEELKAAPERLKSQIAVRAALEASAREHLGSKVKLDSLDDKQIKLLILERLNPKFDSKGKSDAYIDARLDSEIERIAREKDDAADADVALDRARTTVDGGDHEDEEDGEGTASLSAAEARKKMIQRHQDAANSWRKKDNAA